MKPLGRILTAEQAGLYADAAEALAQARAQAAAMLADAADAIAAQRAHMLAEAGAEAQRQATVILAEAAAAARHQLATLEPAAAQALCTALGRLVGGLVPQEAVAAAARVALADLAQSRAIAVHVHPECAEATRTALAEWGEGVRVIADHTLPEDSCTIESPAGIVRAGLSDQLAILQAAILRAGGPP